MDRYFSPHGEPLEVLEWAKMFERRRRGDSSWWLVGRDTIGDVEISTVWIGLDMNLLSYLSDQPPLIFESMVFGGMLDGEQRRYATWAEAEAGHGELVELVRLEQAVEAS